MHLTMKIFLLSLVVIFLFHPHLFGKQIDSKFDGTEGEKTEFVIEKDFKPNIPPYDNPFEFLKDKYFKQKEIRAYNSVNNLLILKEQAATQTIIDDFLVNDDTIGGASQNYPNIARDPSGNFIITWMDYRKEGSSINNISDIYAQMYDSEGHQRGANFIVNEITGVFAMYPSIAVDYSGDFIITWMDAREGNYDIYAQRYNSSGNLIGSNFKVNDDIGSNLQRSPAVAIDCTGNFVISWYDNREGNYDIWAQRFDSDSNPIGSNFKVNDDTGTSNQNHTSVATDWSGNFIICWEDDRNGRSDIYAQRYDYSGNPINSNFMVNDDINSAWQTFPKVANDGYGNFIITWDDNRRDSLVIDIFAQRYDSSGTCIGSNFRVNDDTGTVIHVYPSVCMNGSGEFVISWIDERAGIHIYAQRYDSAGTTMSSNFQVDDITGGIDWYSMPSIASDSSGRFVVTWRDIRNGFNNGDIYSQSYNSSGNSIGSNFKVNDDGASSDQELPDIAVDTSGNFIVTWKDYRNGNYPDFYAQRCSSSGALLGYNFKVNDTDIGSNLSYYSSAIAIDCSGNFVITWGDERNDNPDIYAQRYDFTGNPIDINFMVNDDIDSASQFYMPAIAIDCSGNFVITWEDNRSGTPSIYAQRYDFLGNCLGSNFKVNDEAGFTDGGSPPAITMGESGNFVIVWEDDRDDSNGDIFAQRYNNAGNPIGTNFKVNDDTLPANQWSPPAIAMDNSNNFVITWYDQRNNEWDIYAQRFDSLGSPLGSNFKVNDDIGTDYQYNPAIVVDETGEFTITWDDYRNSNWDIYAQRYDKSGNPLGGNYFVPKIEYASFAQNSPAVAGRTSKVYYTWQDNRRTKGWDIYAKGYYLLRGNVNGDGQVSLADIVYLINYLFKQGEEPIPDVGVGDTNCDGQTSLSDIVYLISYLFKQGSPPCP